MVPEKLAPEPLNSVLGVKVMVAAFADCAVTSERPTIRETAASIRRIFWTPLARIATSLPPRG
jgi:hypothetical protein